MISPLFVQVSWIPEIISHLFAVDIATSSAAAYVTSTNAVPFILLLFFNSFMIELVFHCIGESIGPPVI